MSNILDKLQEDKLTAEITSVGARTIMSRWRDTAFEISRTKHNEIARLHEAYSECSSDELKPAKVIGYLDSLYNLLKDENERGQLITAEAIHLFKANARR